MMRCELWEAHDTKTLERSIPMPSEAEMQKKNYGELMSRHYAPILQSTAPYYDVTTTFMFSSRNKWNVQYIAGSNLWDA